MSEFLSYIYSIIIIIIIIRHPGILLPHTNERTAPMLMISKGVRTIKLAPTQQTSSSSKMPFGRPGSKGSSTQGDPEDPTKLLGFLGHEKTLGQMKRGQQSLNTSHLDEVSQLYWKSVRQGWPAPHSVYNDGIPQGWMQESLKILPKTVHRIAEQVKFVTDMDVSFIFAL
jgi:hypothetical protein|tara:strand:+ start:1208 stop:1717 length:510 start_codon:yes stop_codon:yes gene_type:complete